jgi:ketosteroid isomerase-like protein
MDEIQQRKLEELVCRGIDAYNRGDVQMLVELLDEEVEVYTPPELPNAGTYRGHEGFLQWASQWEEAWEEFRLKIERIAFVGEDHAVSPCASSGAAWGAESRSRCGSPSFGRLPTTR